MQELLIIKPNCGTPIVVFWRIKDDLFVAPPANSECEKNR